MSEDCPDERCKTCPLKDQCKNMGSEDKKNAKKVLRDMGTTRRTLIAGIIGKDAEVKFTPEPQISTLLGAILLSHMMDKEDGDDDLIKTTTYFRRSTYD
ncbi:unnamed protein product, partial [marine sediment metagenome]